MKGKSIFRDFTKDNFKALGIMVAEQCVIPIVSALFFIFLGFSNDLFDSLVGNNLFREGSDTRLSILTFVILSVFVLLCIKHTVVIFAAADSLLFRVLTNFVFSVFFVGGWVLVSFLCSLSSFEALTVLSVCSKFLIVFIVSFLADFVVFIKFYF